MRTEEPVSTTQTIGSEFAQALAARDFDRIAGLLHPEIDFRALTPRRFWEASSPQQVVDEILTTWFEESDVVEDVLAIETGGVADREHVSYRFAGTNPDGAFVVEQQAYYTQRDGRIDWMRVLCSGYCPR